MEHNVIAVLLNARAADQRRKAGRLGAGSKVLFVMISIVVFAGWFILFAITRN